MAGVCIYIYIYIYMLTPLQISMNGTIPTQLIYITLFYRVVKKYEWDKTNSTNINTVAPT